MASWVLVQVASELLPAFDIPDSAIRFVWIGVALGFPLAVLVGWRYDISSRGVRKTGRPGADPATDSPLSRFDYALLSGVGLIAIGIAGVLTVRIAGHQLPASGESPRREVSANSVAVLPLDNFTGDPDQEYFVAGLHEALTAGLTGIRALKVISRTSASAVAASGKTLPEIGRALGVRNVIEGSVFQSGNRVRVTVQLIDALTDQHLWAENFEREFTDLLVLQSDLTRAIARQIQVNLTPEEDRRLSLDRQIDPRVYQLYLKGMYFLKQYTPESIQKGLPYLHQAVELDPSNARAWAGLALGYNTIGHHFGENAFPKALAAARRALELDEYSGEAWAALAEAQVYYEYDWEASRDSFTRALELAPSLDEAHAHYAYLLALFGNWDSALEHSLRARELNPLNQTWAAFSGWLFMVQKDFERAEMHLRESLEIAPGYPLGLWFLGDTVRMQGRIDEAIELQERIPPVLPVRDWALGPTYAVAGRIEDARAAIESMSAERVPKDALFAGLTYAALGDFDQAMFWLEQCYRDRLDWLPWIALEQGYGGVLEKLRPDPRFRSLIDRLEIPHTVE